MIKYVITIYQGSRRYYYAGLNLKHFSVDTDLLTTENIDKAYKCNNESEALEFISYMKFCPVAIGKGLAFGIEPWEPKPETLWDKIAKMSKEEFAEWLFANCEYLSAEYGSCSGESDSSGILRLLDSAAGGDW